MSHQEPIRERLRALKVFDGDLPVFDVANAPNDPAVLFREWLIGAIDAGVCEPHALTLSTVDQDGRPTSRVLILKDLDDGRWHFASSALSRKGRELASTPWVAACFHWPELGRQVRLRGRVVDAGPEASADDFRARPAGSRAETLAGHQSEVLSDPSELAAALAEVHERMRANPALVAEDWTLYHLVPDEVEFWQADPERRHRRLRYLLRGDRWVRELLWP